MIGMGGMAEWDLDMQEKIREEYGLPEDAEIDIREYEGLVSADAFEFFGSSLERRGVDADHEPDWDVFVSYASEQRDAVAQPLTDALGELGLRVWLDAEQFRGQYAYRAINEALPSTAVGVVVITPEYVHKEWTKYELEGVVDSGCGTLVFIGYQLPRRAEEVLRMAVQQLDGSVDAWSVLPRSGRMRGLSKRIRASVRRAKRLKPDELEPAAEGVRRLLEDVRHEVNMPASIAERRRRRELDILCREEFGGNWEAMMDYLEPDPPDTVSD